MPWLPGRHAIHGPGPVARTSRGVLHTGGFEDGECNGGGKGEDPIRWSGCPCCPSTLSSHRICLPPLPLPSKCEGRNLSLLLVKQAAVLWQGTEGSLQTVLARNQSLQSAIHPSGTDVANNRRNRSRSFPAELRLGSRTGHTLTSVLQGSSLAAPMAIS